MIILIACFAGSAPAAIRFVVDMDTAVAGIQSRARTVDTADMTVAIIAESLANANSLECAVVFDSTSLTYLQCASDLGPTGPVHVLTSAGGSIIGGCQLQANPPRGNTVTFFYAITGINPAQAVTGSGVAGVLRFRPRLATGDSATIGGISARAVDPIGIVSTFTGVEFARVVRVRACTLTVAPSATSSCTQPAAVTALQEDTVNITAQACAGYRLTVWRLSSGAGHILDSTATTARVVLDSSGTLTAVYEQSTPVRSHACVPRVVATPVAGVNVRYNGAAFDLRGRRAPAVCP